MDSGTRLRIVDSKWDGVKALETINLNNVSYRAVPDDGDDANNAAGSSDDASDHTSDNDDDISQDNGARDDAAMDVLQGDDAACATQLLADAQRPELFVAPNPNIANKARSVLRALYAYAVRAMADGAPSLRTLHTDQAFDAEQVWLQLDMALGPSLAQAGHAAQQAPPDLQLMDADMEDALNDLLEGNGGEAEDLASGSTSEGALTDGEDGGDALTDGEDGGDGLTDGEDGGDGHPEALVNKGRGGVEDRFFRLSDLEKFLEDGERWDARRRAVMDGEAESSEEDVSQGGDEERRPLHKRTRDDGATDSEEEEAALEALLAKSAAAAKRSRHAGGDAEMEDDQSDNDGAAAADVDVDGGVEEDQPLDGDFGLDEDEEDGDVDQDVDHEVDHDEGVVPGTASRHAKALEELRARMQRLEEENIGEREWVLRGEVQAGDRPLNSALEVDLDFDRNTAPAPPPTEEATVDLETLITRRITEQRFDDVVRVAAPPPERVRTVVELDDRKAEAGLGEVYEQDYLAATGKVAATGDKAEPLREEARRLFKATMAKLDALSHFQFTPQPTVEELTVKADAPALLMEEVAPQVVSTASMKTAAEVFTPSAPGGLVRDVAELSREERRAIRGKKKRGAKKRNAAKAATQQATATTDGGTAPMAGRKSYTGRRQQEEAAKDLKRLAKAAAKKGLAPKSKEVRRDYTKSADVFAAIQEARAGPSTPAPRKQSAAPMLKL